MEFILSYPSWFFVFCLLTGIVFAGILYFRDNQLPDAPDWLKKTLAGIRFVLITLITFLLLEPLVKSETRKVEKPVIVIGQDNSSSILLAPDSNFYRTEYLTALEKLKTDLSEKYDVRTYTIGQELKEGLEVNYREHNTNLSGLFTELYTRYYKRNLGAVILASDGIYNTGSSPLYGARKLGGVPVFTVAMGDTTVRKDLIIADVAFNRLAYLGNEFPIEVIVDSRKCGGKKSEVIISQNGAVLASRPVSFGSEETSEVIAFKLDARKTGIQKYRIAVTPLDDELTTANNYRDIYIEVLDSRQKIALIANSPHPDIAAIRSAIEENKNYEVTAVTLNEFNELPEKFSLIILHQLPSITSDAKNITDKAAEKRIPVLFVLGSQTSVNGFNNLQTGLSISGNKNNFTNAGGTYNSGFTLFTIDEKGAKNSYKYPPLQIPFGDYKSTPAINSLFRQKIGNNEINAPLIAFNTEKSQKIGIICGEGIWRWKLRNFLDNGDHLFFNELMQKTVQFLASRENKDFFRVYGKSDYLANENIVFDAELYNQAYELVNTPSVEMFISNLDSKEFNRTSNAYQLKAGHLPVGEYKYTAKTTLNNKNLSVSGQFTVSPVQIELTNSRADHQLLYNIALQTKGKMVSARELNKLNDLIRNTEEIVETSITRKTLSDLLNYKLIFFLVLILLSVEWFVRKYSGAY